MLLQEVYLNIFLDRLLDVDAKQYMHESVILVGMSWRDPTARSTVQANSQAAWAGNYSCSFPCWNNVMNGGLCCDDIYLPSFSFSNIEGFSQDRQVDSEIYLGTDDSVLWVVTVLGRYYQPMSFKYFPFTTIDLIISLDFLDTSILVEGHPGVKVLPSAAGPRVFELGLGDDSPQWNVNNASIEVFEGPPLLERLNKYSTQESAPNDPTPFNPSEDASTNWARNSKYRREKIFFTLEVSRFWQWNLVYGVLPVLLCAILGLLIFFQDPGDLGGRFSVIVTVFLALAAIQFVLNDSTPQSTYIQPLQQTILIIYLCFGLSAIESICVYQLTHWKRFAAEQESRNEAWRKYKSRMRQWKRRRLLGENSSVVLQPVEDRATNAVQGSECLPSESSLSENGGLNHADDQSETSGLKSRRLGIRLLPVFKKPGETDHVDDDNQAPLYSKPTISSILREDANYGAALAYYVDRISFTILLLAYVIAVPVIFGTQSGYVPLFSQDVLESQGME